MAIGTKIEAGGMGGNLIWKDWLNICRIIALEAMLRVDENKGSNVELVSCHTCQRDSSARIFESQVPSSATIVEGR